MDVCPTVGTGTPASTVVKMEPAPGPVQPFLSPWPFASVDFRGVVTVLLAVQVVQVDIFSLSKASCSVTVTGDVAS